MCFYITFIFNNLSFNSKILISVKFIFLLIIILKKLLYSSEIIVHLFSFLILFIFSSKKSNIVIYLSIISFIKFFKNILNFKLLFKKSSFSLIILIILLIDNIEFDKNFHKSLFIFNFLKLPIQLFNKLISFIVFVHVLYKSYIKSYFWLFFVKRLGKLSNKIKYIL